MKNRIDHTFRSKEKVLTMFFTAGYPELHDTVPVLKALQHAGVDLVEIGLPFSDPLADGPTIQKCGEQALANGMSTELLFQQLEGVRAEVTVPLVIMGHWNPILQFGVEHFCQRCQAVGIDGLILPDLPPEVYERQYRTMFEAHDLHLIFLVTPETTDKRLAYLDSLSGGFLYALSASQTTGGKQQFGEEQEKYFERLSKSGLRNPVQVGFGIRDAAGYQAATRYLQGGIIGSAYVKALAAGRNFEAITSQFVSGIRPHREVVPES